MSRKRKLVEESGSLLTFTGASAFRARLVLSILSARPIRIREIRSNDESPGLTAAEASFIRLLDKLTNGTHIEINETGTAMNFRPGIIVGGSARHDCSGSSPGARAVGWFIEGILPLAPFAKKPVSLVFENCVTNDDFDMSVDTLKEVTFPLLQRFGIGADDDSRIGLEVNVRTRGAPPLGGGLVEFRCPVLRQLRPVDVTDPGLVKRVRGVAYSTKVSPQVPNRVVSSVRGTLNDLLPDVFIFTDVYSGKTSGASPGFAVSLWAETTTDCRVCAEAAAGAAALPEDLGQRTVGMLLNEVFESGCVDSMHQPLVLTLMALSPEDVSRIRLGRLSHQAVLTLRLIRDFFGVVYKAKTDPETKTAIMSCQGYGYRNVAKQVT